MQRIVTLLAALGLALAACNLPAARPPAPTGTPLPSATPPAAATASPAPTPQAVTSPEPPSPPPPAQSERLAALVGQVSAERLMAHVEELAAIPSRHVNSPAIGDAAATIHDAFASAGGRIAVAYDPFPLAFRGIPTTQANVVATLPGSDPAAGMVVIGAHYDSRTIDANDFASPAPGANDNATGVAVLLELARLLAVEEPLPATVVLVAFSAEEIGSVGSRHFVEQALARGDDIRAMLALDTVGNTAGPGGEGAIRAFSADPDTSPSRQLARSVAWQARGYLPGFVVAVQPAIDRAGRYSDHIPFSEAGIPAMRLIEMVEDANRQHSPLDRPEAISPGYLRQAARVALVAAVSLAGAPPAPGAPSLADPATLAWQPADGAAAYAVAVRQPDALAFERVTRVGGEAQAALDEIGAGAGALVSVAAVGADGLVSAFSPELALER